MSMGPAVLKFSQTPTRQYMWGYTFGFDIGQHFTAHPGQLTPKLGSDNGGGGNVMTFCDAVSDLATKIDFTGFSSGSTIRFDHYAGKYVDGHLEPNTSAGYYYLNDPQHPENSGYFLYVSHHVPTSSVEDLAYFNLPLEDPVVPAQHSGGLFY